MQSLQKWRHDTQHNDIQQNDTHHNNFGNVTLSKSTIQHLVPLFSVILTFCNAERRYAKCRYAECRGAIVCNPV